MVQMPQFPQSFGVSLIVVVFIASLFGTRIFLRSMAQEDKKAGDEARNELPPDASGSGPTNPHSARRTP
jgi:hypothetical protein